MRGDHPPASYMGRDEFRFLSQRAPSEAGVCVCMAWKGHTWQEGTNLTYAGQEKYPDKTVHLQRIPGMTREEQ